MVPHKMVQMSVGDTNKNLGKSAHLQDTGKHHALNAQMAKQGFTLLIDAFNIANIGSYCRVSEQTR